MPKLTPRDLFHLKRVEPQPLTDFNFELCAYLCVLDRSFSLQNHSSQESVAETLALQQKIQRFALEKIAVLADSTILSNQPAAVLLAMGSSQETPALSLRCYLEKYFTTIAPMTLENFVAALVQDAAVKFIRPPRRLYDDSFDIELGIEAVKEMIEKVLYGRLKKGVIAQMESRAGPHDEKYPPVTPQSVNTSTVQTVHSTADSSQTLSASTTSTATLQTAAPAALVEPAHTPPAAEKPQETKEKNLIFPFKKEKSLIFFFKSGKPSQPFEPLFCAILCLRELSINLSRENPTQIHPTFANIVISHIFATRDLFFRAEENFTSSVSELIETASQNSVRPRLVHYLKNYFSETEIPNLEAAIQAYFEKHLAPLVKALLNEQTCSLAFGVENLQRLCAKLALDLAPLFPKTGSAKLQDGVRKLATEEYSLPTPATTSTSSSSLAASSSTVSTTTLAPAQSAPAVSDRRTQILPAALEQKKVADALQATTTSAADKRPGVNFNPLYCATLGVQGFAPRILQECKGLSVAQIEANLSNAGTFFRFSIPIAYLQEIAGGEDEKPILDNYIARYFPETSQLASKTFIQDQVEKHLKEFMAFLQRLAPTDRASALNRKNFQRLCVKIALDLTPHFEAVDIDQVTNPFLLFWAKQEEYSLPTPTVDKPAEPFLPQPLAPSESASSSSASPPSDVAAPAVGTQSPPPVLTVSAATAQAGTYPEPAQSLAPMGGSSASPPSEVAASAAPPLSGDLAGAPARPPTPSALNSDSSASASSSSNSSSSFSSSSSSTLPNSAFSEDGGSSSVSAAATSSGMFSKTGCLRPKRLVVGILVGAEVVCAVLCVRSLPQNPRAHLNKVFSNPWAIAGMAIAVVLIGMAIKAAVDHRKAASEKSANMY